MPFDLGSLTALAQPHPGPPSGHKGASDALGEYGRAKISAGYLANQIQQEERLNQEHAYARTQEEKKTRQAAIDAWLSAVRSGNRADIFVLGKRLKGMGVNVQMPDAFSASGIPGEGDLAPTGAPPTDAPPNPPDEQPGPRTINLPDQMIGGDKEGPRTINMPDQMIGGPGPGVGPGPAPAPMSAPGPFGPGGMGAPPAPAPPPSTWRVSDPVTGADIEIAPEQILADQEREIDQSFLPLINMPGLDPVAQRGYQIGHEFAKGQLGFKTPAEAVKAGMEAADRYMNHMYKTGLLAAKPKGRGGGGGAGTGGAPAGKSRIDLAREAADVNSTDKISRGIRETVKTVYSHENYKLVTNELNQLVRAVGSLSTKTSLGERTSFRQLMTAVESRLSNADAEYYQQAGGLRSRLNQAINYIAGGGELSETQIREVRALTQQLQNGFAKRQSTIQQQGAEAGGAYLDGFKLSPEQREVFDSQVRAQTGGGGGKGGNASTQKAKGLL